MSEKTLWMWLKNKVPQTWHIVRIESGTVDGIPDVNYCSHSGMEGWVELKHATTVKKTSVPAWGHELTKPQAHFLTKRHANQSCSGILCQVLRERFFIPAGYAPQFNALTLEQLREYDILDAWLKE